MKKDSLRTLYGLFVILILTTVTNCSLTEANNDITELPTDIPLSEYILGSWSTEHIYLPNGDEETYFGYDITFIDYDTVQVVVKEDGDPMDITISQYHFVDSDTIFVDNKRIRGGETLHLERDAQKLIIRTPTDEGQETLTVLRRN